MVQEARNANIPNQLMTPSDTNKEEETDKNEIEDIKEFSTCAAVSGYAIPLGMDPDLAGRQKNRIRRKKHKKS